MSEIEARIAALSDRKLRLLYRLLETGPEDGVKPVRLQRLGRTVAPTTVAQARIWAMHQRDPTSTVSNVRLALRLVGKLRTRELTRSLNTIVHRHEALRTRFGEENGEVMQVVAPPSRIAVPVEDFRGLAGDVRDERVKRVMLEETARPFDLGRGPILRVRILRLAHDEHVLLITVHHIVFEGWSIWIFLRELAVIYAANCEGRPCPLPEPPLQFSDYAVWQRNWLRSQEHDRQLAHWKHVLAAAPSTIEIPSKIPRPDAPLFEGDHVSFAVEKTLVDALRVLSSRQGATLFMTLFGGFAALLSRLTGQRDIVIGTPIAGRNDRALEETIGMFANIVPVRIRLEGNPSFLTLLRQVRAGAESAYIHQELPIEELIRELNPTVPANRAPLFQVLFALHNYPRATDKLMGLDVSAVRLENALPFRLLEFYSPLSAPLDLCLGISEKSTGLAGVLEYNRRALDSVTVHSISANFRQFLGKVAKDPTVSVLAL